MFKVSRRRALFLAALLILTTSAAFAASPIQTPEWTTLTPPGEGFSVNLPMKPEIESQRVPVMGNSYQLRLYTASEKTTGLVYMVVMQEFPSVSGAPTPAVRLEKFMNGFKQGLGESLATAAGSKVDLVFDRDANLGANLGRHYLLAIGETRGLIRVFDGGRRVYLLMALGADEKNSSVSRFLDSFEIKTAPDPVPQPLVDTKSP